MSGWTLAASPVWLVVGIMVVAVTAWLSWRQWRRLRSQPAVLGLEVVRVVTVALLVVTLWRPELARQQDPRRQPEVAVLWDASRSMTTKDVALNGAVLTREEWVRQQLASEVWAGLSNRFRLAVESFSAPATNAADADGTDLDGALEAALNRHRDLRAVVLLSDGDWNVGRSPVAAATKLQVRQVPVFSVAVGSREYLPDVALENLSAPAYGLLGEQVMVGFKVRSYLPREVRTTVRLVDDRGTETTKDLVIPPMAQVQEAVLWTPTREGTAALTLRLPVETEELRDDNNQLQATVAVRKEILRVLVVESLPRWEYRYLRNALQRDPGVDVQTVLFHPGMKPGGGMDYLEAFPATREELSKYDVVFLGDVGIGGGELTLEQAEELRGLVEQQGSGLVFLPGSRGRQLTLASSALGGLVPVEMDELQPRGAGAAMPAKLALTARGQGHLLTMLAGSETQNVEVWRKLPGFYWHAAVKKAKPGADVLAVHEGLRNEWGRVPLLVSRPQGSGKVLFMGVDSAWRWRRGVEDVYHYRFWGQVVRWMAYQRHRAQNQGIRVFFNPDDPQRGERVAVHATVFDANGLPLRTGPVTAEISAPGGKTERFELQSVAGGWGVFVGQFTPQLPGTFAVKVRAEPTGKELAAELVVRGQQREQVGRPAQPEILREIANITRGRMGGPAELASFVSQIEALPKQTAVEQRVRLWCHPLWGGLILTLLAVYWAGRKLVGLV